jgi:predicted secreted hydrolase
MADQRRGMAFDFVTTPERPLIFEGPNGFSRKGPGPTSASQYYSFTRLRTTGTLTLGDSVFPAAGRSWMDQEIGSNQLADRQVGWDWFALQLDDGRDLMLYVLRDSSGATSWASGTLVPRAGAPRYLAAADFTVDAHGAWKSDSSGATYPARWTLTLPREHLVLDVVPLAADQENRSAIPRGLFYWEGAVEARIGRRTVGRGYVELTGYGHGIRPAL